MPQLLEQLEQLLVPSKLMLEDRPYFCSISVRTSSTSIFSGCSANFLYSGHYELPAIHTRLNEWYRTMPI